MNTDERESLLFLAAWIAMIVIGFPIATVAGTWTAELLSRWGLLP